MKLLLHFLCLEVLPVCLGREVKPFIIWFYPPWLDYDVSMHRLVELIVVIPTSPRSLKMECERSSYGRFGFSCFCLFQGRRLQPKMCFCHFSSIVLAQNLRVLFQIKDSGPSLRTSKTWGVAPRRDGGGSFLAPTRSLRPPKAGDSRESGLQRLFSCGDL
jgi:hypothetical protein